MQDGSECDSMPDRNVFFIFERTNRFDLSIVLIIYSFFASSLTLAVSALSTHV